MTTIYVDSRKRVAGDDSSFEFDIGETIHLQTGARLSVLKFRVADAFLSTDRGFYMYWIDALRGESSDEMRVVEVRQAHVSDL